MYKVKSLDINVDKLLEYTAYSNLSKRLIERLLEKEVERTTASKVIEILDSICVELVSELSYKSLDSSMSLHEYCISYVYNDNVKSVEKYYHQAVLDYKSILEKKDRPTIATINKVLSNVVDNIGSQVLQ